MPLAVPNYLGQDPQILIFKANVEKVNSEQIKITYTTSQYDENLDVTYTFSPYEHQLNIKSLLPDIGANIDFLVDGSVVINECDHNYDINIKTNANITVINEINCNRLTLSGNGIFLKHNIKSVNRCTLEYQEQLENHGKLLVVGSSLEFIGACGSKLSNFGVIDTRGIITFNIKNNHRWSKLINYGLIFSRQDIFMNAFSFYNFNSILSKAKITAVTKKIFNCGIIFAEKDLGFRYSYDLINENNAIIASNRDLYLTGLASIFSEECSRKNVERQRVFINKGTIKSFRNLGISSAAINNAATGLMQANKVSIYGDRFVNDGHINGTNKIEISFLSDIEGFWHNSQTGVIQTVNLSCFIQGLLNEGKIVAQQEFKFLKNLKKKTDEEMLSHTNMSLWFLEQLISDAVMQANEELLVDGELIKIIKECELAYNKISINNKNMVAEAKISTEQLCKIKSIFFDPHIGSKAVTADELKMHFCQDQISMYGCSYIVQPFVPVKIASDSNLFFNVKQRKFAANKVELKSVEMTIEVFAPLESLLTFQYRSLQEVTNLCLKEAKKATKEENAPPCVSLEIDVAFKSNNLQLSYT